VTEKSVSSTSQLLVLSVHPESAAATRFRATAFFPYLRARGIEPDFHPFLTEKLFGSLLAHDNLSQKALALAELAALRIGLLLKAKRYDAVFIQREALMVGPPVIEIALAKVNQLPIIYDMDDALWLAGTPPPSSLRAQFPLLGNLIRWPKKANTMVKIAQETIVGSRYLASYCQQFTSAITVLPTVVSKELWQPKPCRLQGDFYNDPPIIGWIGTHGTAVYLDMVLPVLSRLAKEGHQFRFRVRGASRDLKAEGVTIENLPWRKEHEVDDFAEIDIGIAPMFDDEWAKGKCGFKNLQYMSVGVPMVATNVGGAEEFLKHNHNAWLAYSEQDWYEGLRRLLTDQELRRQFSQNGRSLMEQQFCTEVVGPCWVDVIERAISRQRSRQ
jgi:glycosyltransferase involved in cell wall biosynthesis